MNFKIEYLIDKNRIVTILQERVKNYEHTIYSLEKIGEDGVIIYMVYDNELACCKNYRRTGNTGYGAA